MKNSALIIIFSLIGITIVSFSFITKNYSKKNALEMYNDNLSLNREIINYDLANDLLKKFPLLLTEIKKIEALQNHSGDLFYSVDGYLNGELTNELFKIHAEDLLNETYSFIDFSSLEISTEITEYCREYAEPCPITGCHYGYNCKGAICGILTSRGCAVY